MDFDTDYCLLCSRQTSGHGRSYCSTKCRKEDKRRSSFYLDDDSSSCSSASPSRPIQLQRQQHLHHHQQRQRRSPSPLPEPPHKVYDDNGINSWRRTVSPAFGLPGPSTPSHHHQHVYGPPSTPKPEFPLSRQRPAAPTLCTGAQGSLHAPRPVVTYTVSRVGSGTGFGAVGEALVRSLSPSLLAGPHPHPPQSPPPHRSQAYASPAPRPDALRAQTSNGVFEGLARRIRSAWNQQRDSPSPARPSTGTSTANANARSSSSAAVRPLPQRPDGSRVFAKRPAEIRVMHETQVRDATPAGSLSVSPPSSAAGSSTSLFLDASPLTLPPLALNVHLVHALNSQFASAATSSSSRAAGPHTPSFAPTNAKPLRLKPKMQLFTFPVVGRDDEGDEGEDESEDEAELKRRFPQIRRPTVIETLEECRFVREPPIAVRIPSANDVAPAAAAEERRASGGAKAKAIWIAGKREEALSEFGPVYYDLSDSRTREPHRPASPLASLSASSPSEEEFGGGEGERDGGFGDAIGEELWRERREEAWKDRGRRMRRASEVRY